MLALHQNYQDILADKLAPDNIDLLTLRDIYDRLTFLLLLFAPDDASRYSRSDLIRQSHRTVREGHETQIVSLS